MVLKSAKSSGLVLIEVEPDTTKLLTDLRELIEAGRARVAQAVNARMVLLYRSIGSHPPSNPCRTTGQVW